MRKELFTIASAALIAVMSLTACSKSADKPAGATYTKQQLAGTYHAVKITTLTSNENIIDDVMESCETDDYQVLNEDMTAEYVDAGEVCDEDGSGEGTWSISGNKLTINTETITILSLSEDEMVATTNSPVGIVKVTFEKN